MPGCGPKKQKKKRLVKYFQADKIYYIKSRNSEHLTSVFLLEKTPHMTFLGFSIGKETTVQNFS